MKLVIKAQQVADKGVEYYGADGAGAVYSECDAFRFLLWRRWKPGPIAMFDMLNPSTATHLELDPTLRRCKGYALAWGYSGFVIGNLFAFRATEPEDMKRAADPIGDGNDGVVITKARQVIAEGGVVVCGWGTHGIFMNRCLDFKATARRQGIKLHYLKLTSGKVPQPSHPLYLKSELTPQLWV
jgi:hypothetical protein